MTYRLTAFVIMLTCVLRSTAQTTLLPTPAGSVNFGWGITVLPNGNYVIIDPFFSEGGINNKGAVYLYNGSTNALISTLKGSQSGDNIGSNLLYVLPNSNFVVCSQEWDNGPIVNAGAVTFINGTTGLNGVVNSSNSLVAGSANSFVGSAGPVIVLPNGNYIVRSYSWRNGSAPFVGAITWGSGTTGVSGVISSANSLVGTTNSDGVGNNVLVLPNSNYISYTTSWDNGSAADAGAVTFCNGAAGTAGIISSTNSLVGSSANDRVGNGVLALANGNYVVQSPFWQNSTGAVTWSNGTTGLTGAINSTNSLIGSATNNSVGATIVALNNGNYVVASPGWDNGALIDAGAVTWCNGTTGLTGTVSTSNSLAGGKANDFIGNSGILALSNGHYVVQSSSWDNGAISDVGAATWCNGTTGRTGAVSAANSLVGAIGGDRVSSGGSNSVALNNGNYVISSPSCGNSAESNVGAATWGNGATGTTGTISSLNSIVGGTGFDRVSSERIVALNNGNYVVSSPYWQNGANINAGAVTWGNGATGTSGVVNSSNSLVGSTANDEIGSSVPVALSNGNFVIYSQYWNNGSAVDAGVVTWGNGATGTSGVIGSSNSLVGSTGGDNVGAGGITMLANGNYVVRSAGWDNGSIMNTGAVIWCSGTTGKTGVVSSANALIGSTANNFIGDIILPLANGNYIVASPKWGNGTISQAGAVTWCNGTSGLTGEISAQNSLVGSSNNDNVGNNFNNAFSNGHYTTSSYMWDNGATPNAGAVTWGNGNTGTIGAVSSCNSVLGSTPNSPAGYQVRFNDVYNRMIVGEFNNNRVSIFQPDGMTLAVSLDSISTNLSGNSFTPLIASAACRLIATVTPNGASRISGNTMAKVWIESSVPVHAGQPFVARHYQITPDNNAAAATARITLYCTQQEFDDYNIVATNDLPTNTTDAAGKSRLRVIKYPGVSNDYSGLPASYTGTPVELDPDDAAIVWNSSLGRWEISVEVTGFSGFFIQALGASVPLRLLQLNASPDNNNVLVSWKTTNEVNTQGFDVERSMDGRNFSAVGFVPAINRSGDHFYSFTDIGAAMLHTQKLYYRLKQKDIDGRMAYSQIVMVRLAKDNGLLVYPNPATDIISISIGNKALLRTSASITDMQGKTIKQFTINNYQETVNIAALPQGIFIIKFEDGTAVKLVKDK